MISPAQADSIQAELAQHQILVGERLYAEAMDIVLENAQHNLIIFDQDLSHGDFAGLKKHALLERFLAQPAPAKLVIVLQDTRFLLESCPRLLNLLKVYGHKMTVYETDNSAKHAKDCFVLADGRHYIRRIHIDQARFKYALNDVATVESLTSRFEDLLEATQHALTPTTLGL